MDYKAALAEAHSRENSDRIVKAIGKDPKEFKKIIEIIYKGEAPLPQRASWVLGLVSRNNPQLIKPYLEKFIGSVQGFKTKGVKRNMMQAISTQDIPEVLQSKVLDICFEQILSSGEEVAVKVWALETAANITQHHPGLLNELKSVIDDQVDRNSIAFRTRARKILKRISP